MKNTIEAICSQIGFELMSNLGAYHVNKKRLDASGTYDTTFSRGRQAKVVLIDERKLLIFDWACSKKALHDERKRPIIAYEPQNMLNVRAPASGFFKSYVKNDRKVAQGEILFEFESEQLLIKITKIEQAQDQLKSFLQLYDQTSEYMMDLNSFSESVAVFNATQLDVMRRKEVADSGLVELGEVTIEVPMQSAAGVKSAAFTVNEGLFEDYIKNKSVHDAKIYADALLVNLQNILKNLEVNQNRLKIFAPVEGDLILINKGDVATQGVILATLAL